MLHVLSAYSYIQRCETSADYVPIIIYITTALFHSLLVTKTKNAACHLTEKLHPAIQKSSILNIFLFRKT